MENSTKEFFMEKAKELTNSKYCCNELKEAAQSFLAALGTEKEEESTERFIGEVKDDIMTVDQVISFVESKEGIQRFGAETAKGIAAHAKDIKAKGAKYCDCPACAAAEAILEKI